MSIKLDNEPFDRGHIAIHDDFVSLSNGEWFCNLATYNLFDMEVYSEQSFRWHISQAQEFVDEVIQEILNHE